MSNNGRAHVQRNIFLKRIGIREQLTLNFMGARSRDGKAAFTLDSKGDGNKVHSDVLA